MGRRNASADGGGPVILAACYLRRRCSDGALLSVGSPPPPPPRLRSHLAILDRGLGLAERDELLLVHVVSITALDDLVAHIIAMISNIAI